jgi:hypothetical protein
MLPSFTQHHRRAKHAVVLLASIGGAALLPAQASANNPGALYRLTAATVATNWSYSYTATDDDNVPYTDTGGEAAKLALSKALSPSLDADGIYTAGFGGTLNGSYASTSSDGSVTCPPYTLDPAALQEELQLNVVPISHDRFVVTAGLGLGEDAAALTAWDQEVNDVTAACGGSQPTLLGYGLTFTPAPNNVHIPQCQGISQGCEILPRSRFRSRKVQIAITDSVPVSAAQTAMAPTAATGQGTYAWTINVTLTRA